MSFLKTIRTSDGGTWPSLRSRREMMGCHFSASAPAFLPHSATSGASRVSTVTLTGGALAGGAAEVAHRAQNRVSARIGVLSRGTRPGGGCDEVGYGGLV